MKVGDLVRCTTRPWRHIVGIVVEYPDQKWNVPKRYIKVMVADDCRETIEQISEFEVINESR